MAAEDPTSAASDEGADIFPNLAYSEIWQADLVVYVMKPNISLTRKLLDVRKVGVYRDSRISVDCKYGILKSQVGMITSKIQSTTVS